MAGLRSAGPVDRRQRRGDVVVVVGGVGLELLASATTSEPASDHRRVAVVLVPVIGAGFHGLALGRRQ